MVFSSSIIVDHFLITVDHYSSSLSAEIYLLFCKKQAFSLIFGDIFLDFFEKDSHLSRQAA